MLENQKDKLTRGREWRRLRGLSNTALTASLCGECGALEVEAWLHATRVLAVECGCSDWRRQYSPRLILDSGGWWTVTTRRRINEVLGVLAINAGVGVSCGLWSVYTLPHYDPLLPLPRRLGAVVLPRVYGWTPKPAWPHYRSRIAWDLLDWGDSHLSARLGEVDRAPGDR